MVKIGGVSIDTSHPLCFAEELEKSNIGMRYEYECNLGFRGKEETEWFAKRFGVKLVNSIEEMADKVDVGLVQSCNWEKHLAQAMPFIKAGTPVFIDKPIVGSVKDAKKLIELVKGGAKIYGASAMRYVSDIQDFLDKPVEERGEVVSVFVEGGVNEFDYAIHSMEIASAFAGAKVVSNKFVGSAKDGKNNPLETFYVEFENGVTATIKSYHNTWCRAMAIVMTTKGPVSFELDGFKAFNCTLKEIEKQISTGKSRLVDVDTLVNCSLAMIAGKKSRDSLSGQRVELASLCDEDGFDGYAFEEKYASVQLSRPHLYKD
jgi:predicted dehydrogenase